MGLDPLVSGIAAIALATAPATPALAPPSQPGSWHQLGAAVTSRPGKALHVYRTAQNPTALGVVVSSASSKPIYMFWSSYCEVESDDMMSDEQSGVVRGTKRVTAYPPTLKDATVCYVWVNARAPGKAKVTAAIFSY